MKLDEPSGDSVKSMDVVQILDIREKGSKSGNCISGDQPEFQFYILFCE